MRIIIKIYTDTRRQVENLVDDIRTEKYTTQTLTIRTAPHWDKGFSEIIKRKLKEQ